MANTGSYTLIYAPNSIYSRAGWRWVGAPLLPTLPSGPPGKVGSPCCLSFSLLGLAEGQGSIGNL